MGLMANEPTYPTSGPSTQSTTLFPGTQIRSIITIITTQGEAARATYSPMTPVTRDPLQPS